MELGGNLKANYPKSQVGLQPKKVWTSYPETLAQFQATF